MKQDLDGLTPARPCFTPTGCRAEPTAADLYHHKMLSKAGMLDRLRSGEIKIGYSFDTLTSPPTQLSALALVEPDDPTSIGTQLFEKNFFGQRLSLTLGPLILSHTYSWHRGRKRYKGTPDVFDLRESNGSIEVQPGESVTVNSNENVSVGRETGAITYPRLSHATAGLVLSASYIDPCWDGILVLNVSNNSRRPISLKFGEKFAATFFYDLQGGPAEADLPQRFAQKSHHFGLSWDRILTTDANPFPVKKQPVPGLLRRSDLTAREFAGRFGKTIVAGGISISLVAGTLISLGSFQSSVAKVGDLEKGVQQQAKDLADTRSALANLVVMGARSGSSIITVPAGSRDSSVDIQLPAPNTVANRSSSPVAIGTSSDPDWTVEADVNPGSAPGSFVLHLTVRRSSTVSVTTRVVVQYIVV